MTNLLTNEVVIVDAVRTPIGRAGKGRLAQVRADDLGAFILRQLMDRVGGGLPTNLSYTSSAATNGLLPGEEVISVP